MGKKKQPIREMSWEAIEAGASIFLSDDQLFATHQQASVLYRDDIYIYGGKDEVDEPKAIFIKYNTKTTEYKKLSTALSPISAANPKWMELEKGKSITIKGSQMKMPSIYQHTLTYVEGRQGESDMILIIGGKWRKPHSDHEVVNDKVYAYNVDMNKWVTIQAEGLTARFDHTTTLHPNLYELFVFGGTDADGNVLSDLMKLDIQQGRWFPCSTKGKTSPKGTSGHTAVMHDDFIYIFGGKSNDELSNEMHRLHMNTLQWEKVGSSQKKSPVYPKKRAGHAAVALFNKMIMYGGEGHNILPSQVWEYDFDDGKWSLPDISQEDTPLEGYTITGHNMCVKDRKVWMIGGIAEDKSQRHINQYLYVLDTKLEGMQLIERPPSTFQQDLATLLNDKFTSDLVIELEGEEHIYAHRFLLSVRCRALYKYMLKHHMGDRELQFEEAMDHLKARRKTHFPYDIENTTTTEADMEVILNYIYVETWPTFNVIEKAKKIMYIAWVLDLKHLANYCHHFVHVFDPCTPTQHTLEWRPTLAQDLKKLCELMFDHYNKVDSMERSTREAAAAQRKAEELDLLLKKDIANKSDNVLATLNSPLEALDNVFAEVSSTSSTSLSPYEDTSDSSTTSTRYSFTSAFDETFDATCDIAFEVHGEQIPAHSAFLVARSRYFQHLIFQAKRKKVSNSPPRAGSTISLVIPMFGVQSNVFKLVLQYLYMDDAKPPYRLAFELLIAAETYGLDRLSAICQRIVARKIALYNVCSYLTLCEEYGLLDLKERCQFYAIHNLNQLKKQKSYSRLSHDLQLQLNVTKKEMKHDDLYDYQYARSIHNHHHAKFQHKKTKRTKKEKKAKRQAKQQQHAKPSTPVGNSSHRYKVKHKNKHKPNLMEEALACETSSTS